MGSLQPSLEDVAYCTVSAVSSPFCSNADLHTGPTAAAVLAESLKSTGTTIPRCVMMTPETMSDKAVSKLGAVFDLVIPVSAVAGLSTSNLDIIGRPDLHATMTKIQLWSLTRFRRVLYLDSDTLVVSNLDHLFDLPEAIGFAAAPEIGFPDCFNSGVMLLQPNAATHAELMRFAACVDSFDGGDQGLLNVFFGDGTRSHPSRLLLQNKKPGSRDPGDGDDHGGTGRNWFRLSFTYNMEMHRVYRFYIPAALRYRDEHKILHFIGKDKPWHYEGGRVDVPDDAGAYHQFYVDMVGKWWDTRRSIAAAL